VWTFGSWSFVSAGCGCCGSSVNWSVIIPAHELHGISVCNCDKIGSSNILNLDAQANGNSAVIGDIRSYNLFFFLMLFLPCEFGRFM
jgi:hypothetical protein